MTFPHFLHLCSLVTYVAANVTVAFQAITAWRRKRRFFFLLISIGSALGAYIIVFDWTIARNQMSQSTYDWLYCMRYIVLLLGVISSAVGVVSLIRSFASQSSNGNE